MFLEHKFPYQSLDIDIRDLPCVSVQMIDSTYYYIAEGYLSKFIFLAMENVKAPWSV